ncbi:MAG: hypothetical protein BHV93_04370 [Clostridiales bacterium 52_15]|nr:MAG: hypothetical protein BHV93_04370 [Clostridiales bacterium 52_15]
MSIKKITAENLRRMDGKEGLILQGCGGSLDEWVDGINDLLTESGILLEGTKFKAENCSAFEHDGLTCLMFPFSEDVKLDVGRLAMWRLQTHGQLGGTWLSDYVPNRLGGFTEEQQKEESLKPDCPLIGQDGNIFNLMGIASRTLRQNGMPEQATEMCSRITETAGSYSEALGIIGEYVNITSVDDGQGYGGDMEMEL